MPVERNPKTDPLKIKMVEYNDKANKARKYYKSPMYFYYLAKMFSILDIVGRKKEYLELVPEVKKWYSFCKNG